MPRWVLCGGLIATLLCSGAIAATADEANSSWSVTEPAYTVQPRVVPIDVTTGTWMSLDVSPDGRWIVFDLLGDLYRLPIDGGTAESLTSGHAWDMQPRFSPDGSKIAFTSDRDGGDNIWTLDIESGALRQISFESFRLPNNPTWHPSGEYIAARKHFTTSRSLGTGEIWLYSAAPQPDSKPQGVRLVKRPSPVFQKELGEPAYAPDGKTLYFTRNSTPGDQFIYHQDTNTEVFQIRGLDTATGETSVVVGGPGGAVRPTPSPNGQYLAFVKRVRAESRLFVKDLNSGAVAMLDAALDPDMQETWGVHGLYPNMGWTPDSAQIVYWKAGQLWSTPRDGSSTAKQIPFRVTDSRTVYPAPQAVVDVAAPTFATKMVRFPSRSPDKRTIVFESLGKLWVKRDDEAPQQLTRHGGFQYSPVWSTDGRTVYYLNWLDSEQTTVWQVSARGGRSRQLDVDPGHYTELHASPDGEFLLFRQLAAHPLRPPLNAEAPGIYRVDLGTKEKSLITKRGYNPHAGLSGRIYFNERASNTIGRGSDTASTKLYSVTQLGEDAREIASSEFGRAIFISPAEDHIAHLENYQVYLTKRPPTHELLALGGKTKSVPSLRASKVGGLYPTWTASGDSLSWSIGPHLKTVDVPTLFDDASAASSVNLSQETTTAVPNKRWALTNVRILTMDEDRRVIDDGVIVVDGNRLAAVGSTEDVTIPVETEVFDGGGRTVIPGLIDAHAHGPYGSNQIILQQNWSLLAHLALGVTTVHDPSSRAELVFAAAEMQRSGAILAPRIFSTGEIVYGAKSMSWAPIESLADAQTHIDRLKLQGAISIKNYNQPRREQRQQVIEATRQAGLISVAEGGSLYHMDLNLVVDGSSGIEHNVPTLRMYDDVTQLWTASDAGYTTTLVVTYGGLTSEDYYYQQSEVWKHPILANFVPPTVLQPRSVRRVMAPESDYRDDDAAAAAKVLMEAGVVVNTGGHGQREGLASHWEMWSFVRGGMSNMQALATATINPAHYLGLAKDLGSLEPGKLADLVLLDGNPLEDIHNTDKIAYVIQNGRLYEAKSLREVMTGTAELAPFWWHTSTHGRIR